MGPAFQSSRFLVFFSLELLIGDASYSQRCLIMRKKELPFVHIRTCSAICCHKRQHQPDQC